jgi:hypothetical protein
MNIWTFCRIVSILFVAVIVSAHAQVDFVKSPSNPILPSWGSDPDDPNGYQVTHSPAVVYDSALSMFRMWFISQSVHGTRTVVSTAISFDGFNWYVSAKNPVLRTGEPGSFDEQVLAPTVIRDDNQYHLYYTGISSTTRQIGHARSIDGIQWTKDSDNPVLSPGVFGEWDSQMIGWCSVLKADTRNNVRSMGRHWTRHFDRWGDLDKTPGKPCLGQRYSRLGLL